MPIALVTATRMEMRHALMGLAGLGGLARDAGITFADAPQTADTPAGERHGAGTVRGVPETAALPARGMAQIRLAERDVLLVVTGVGPVNAALEIGLALGARTDISGVVNLGVAGSFDTLAAPLAAPVAATREIWPEYGLADQEGFVDARAIGFPQWEDPADPGGHIWDSVALDPVQAALAMGFALDPAWVHGASLTVAGVTGTPQRSQALRERTKALTENMEGFPLALACGLRGLPFLEIRTVSNPVGERNRSLWRMREALTGLGEVLATLVKAL